MTKSGFVILIPYDDREGPSIHRHIPYYDHNNERRIDNYDIDRWVPVIPHDVSNIAIWHWPQAQDNFMPLNLRATLAAYYGGARDARLYGDCIITHSNKTSLTLSAANIALRVLDQCHSLAGTLLLSARSRRIDSGQDDLIAGLRIADADDVEHVNGRAWMTIDEATRSDV